MTASQQSSTGNCEIFGNIRTAWGNASPDPVATGADVELSSESKGSPAIPFTMRVTVPAHIMVREVQGESVLLNLNSERYFGLDEVGTRMWAALVASASVQAAYEVLLGEYDVGAEQLRNNLQELIAKLVENGLLEVRSE